MSKRTMDETCLLRLYEEDERTAREVKEWTMQELSSLFHQSERRTSTIVKTLAQANFVKKTKEDRYFLTEHGKNLVRSLKQPA